MSPARTGKMTRNRAQDRVLHILTDTILAMYQHARLETYATALVLLTVYGYVQSVRLRRKGMRGPTVHA